MRPFRAATLLGSSLLLLSLSASAQFYPDRGYPDRGYSDRGYSDRGYSDRGYSDRDYRDGYGRGGGRETALFARTVSDLDRAASSGYYRGGDQRRIDNARKDLWDFQSRLRQGRFDRGELDEAIGSVQKVIHMRSLDYRDRDALENDVERLREFRATQSDRGYYGRRY